MSSTEQYGFGKICTWHGPLTFAQIDDQLTEQGTETYACPKCGRELVVTTAERFWQAVAIGAKSIPEYEGMNRWSEGKCFPDFRTMQDAYRQAMEE